MYIAGWGALAPNILATLISPLHIMCVRRERPSEGCIHDKDTLESLNPLMAVRNSGLKSVWPSDPIVPDHELSKTLGPRPFTNNEPRHLHQPHNGILIPPRRGSDMHSALDARNSHWTRPQVPSAEPDGRDGRILAQFGPRSCRLAVVCPFTSVQNAPAVILVSSDKEALSIEPCAT